MDCDFVETEFYYNPHLRNQGESLEKSQWDSLSWLCGLVVPEVVRTEPVVPGVVQTEPVRDSTEPPPEAATQSNEPEPPT